MARHYTPASSGPSMERIRALVAAGVPAGPLGEPMRFYQVRAGARLHAAVNCGRIRSREAGARYIRLLEQASDAFCTDCTHGATSADAIAYAMKADTIEELKGNLARVRWVLLADIAGRPLVEADDVQEAQLALDLLTPVEVGAVTWERVGQVEALVRVLDDLHTDPLDARLAEYVAPVEAAVRQLHTTLKSRAAAAVDSDWLTRTCVLDLMGRYAAYSYVSPYRAGEPAGAPASSLAPVDDPAKFPAICTSSGYSRAPVPDGFHDLVNQAWALWREQVRATGDVDAAAAAVAQATTIDEHEPESFVQIPAGVVERPAGADVRSWALHAWRAAAHRELSDIVASWAACYTQDLADALTMPRQIVWLREWDAQVRKAVNPATQILAQLTLIGHPEQETALVLAPGIVARWLQRFDITGDKATKQESYSTRWHAQVLREALPSDDVDTLRAAFLLWKPRPNSAPNPGVPLSDLLTAVETAQGITSVA